jgi:replicative DNA helicase
MPAVTSALRKLVAKHPVRLVVIDHLQLMKGTGRFESRHQELSEISHGLKHLAGQFDLTVILLSQLNRECEKANRRPEQYNRQDPSLKGQAEFILGKQRNGPTGKRKMLFQHGYQRFVETTDQMEVGDE